MMTWFLLIDISLSLSYTHTSRPVSFKLSLCFLLDHSIYVHHSPRRFFFLCSLFLIDFICCNTHLSSYRAILCIMLFNRRNGNRLFLSLLYLWFIACLSATLLYMLQRVNFGIVYQWMTCLAINFNKEAQGKNNDALCVSSKVVLLAMWQSGVKCKARKARPLRVSTPFSLSCITYAYTFQHERHGYWSTREAHRQEQG